MQPTPDIQIVIIPGSASEEAGQGFIVIGVQRSVLASHAVMVNDGLRYPQRANTITTYLAEFEVAGMYRERHLAVSDRVSAVIGREADLRQRMAEEDLWVLISLSPELQGQQTIDHQLVIDTPRRFSNVRARDIQQTSAPWAYTGHRRMLLITDYDATEQISRDEVCELHTDGSGTWAISIEAERDTASGSAALDRTLSIANLCGSVLAGVHLLGTHAHEWTGAGGQALIRVRVLIPDGDSLSLTGSHMRSTRDLRVLREDPPVASIYLDVQTAAGFSSAMISAMHGLLNEVTQCFGFPEVAPLLTREGTVDPSQWGNYRRNVEQWVQAHGITRS